MSLKTKILCAFFLAVDSGSAYLYEGFLQD